MDHACAPAVAHNKDWTSRCAEAAAGGLAALAAVPMGALVRDPVLRRLLQAVAAEAAAVARGAGLALAGRPADLAMRLCRESPRRLHPWLRELRLGRSDRAVAALEPLLVAARRCGRPAFKLTVIAATLKRLGGAR